LRKGKQLKLLRNSRVIAEAITIEVDGHLFGTGEDMPDIETKMTRVISSDSHPVTAIRLNPVHSLQEILNRINIEFEHNLPVEAYATALYDFLSYNQDVILTILSRNLITFLIEVWDHDHVAMDESRWEYVRYLSAFGFLYAQRGGGPFGFPDTIVYFSEMKEQFYFRLKSRQSKRLIERYGRWENIAGGLLYHYGIIDTKQFYEIFCLVSEDKEVSYEHFWSFLNLRCSFWNSCVFYSTLDNADCYFQHVNVEDAEQLLKDIKKHEMPYYIPDETRCLDVYSARGLDNSWKGFGSTVDFFYHDLHLDYYLTNVWLRIIVNMIQNGHELEELIKRTESMPLNGPEQKDKWFSCLESLYYSVPVFAFKGNNHEYQKKMNEENTLKKRRKLFTMIDGGKSF